MEQNERATKSSEAMWSHDAASKWLGMQIVDVSEGQAQLDLLVAPHHCNGLGICHGGITFALADSAFAFACNSRNQVAVAQHNTITYVAPAKIGDQLKALAQEVSLSGRSGVYDVRVTSQTGQTIAEFRGLSRIIRGQHFEENPAEDA